MEAFTIYCGLAAPLDRDNVDTDAIIPKQFCKSIARTGFGENLFDAWRFVDPGELGIDPTSRTPRADFVLNRPQYHGATILVAGRNFGCGSSREHAVWALQQYGFRAVIAPSFADIFSDNSFKCGMLPVVLPQDAVGRLMASALERSPCRVEIDLLRQRVTGPDGTQMSFEVNALRKHRLVLGLDEIDLTLQQAEAIRAFERARLAAQPWLDARYAGSPPPYAQP